MNVPKDRADIGPGDLEAMDELLMMGIGLESFPEKRWGRVLGPSG
jgi:hypothetical protein